MGVFMQINTWDVIFSHYQTLEQLYGGRDYGIGRGTTEASKWMQILSFSLSFAQYLPRVDKNSDNKCNTSASRLLLSCIINVRNLMDASRVSSVKFNIIDARCRPTKQTKQMEHRASIPSDGPDETSA